ncbi:oxidoreductase domain-containing protein [Xylariales sp. AK1849]|nr:oxidoreductase domain-containing protein [Xylariales sp. AK1849]
MDSGIPVKTTYASNDVEIPASYLTSEPYDAKPITLSQFNFKDTVLPEFEGGYAVVLDNVLSSSECVKLIELAESSVLPRDRAENDSPWQPALVNIGGGFEVLQANYRNSDRIIWDQQEIVDRMWARMEKVPGIKEELAFFNEVDLLGGRNPNGKPGMDWKFHRVNKRMRFLKYGSGQFFRPHTDGPYSEEGPNGEVLRTHFTVHLYLNDSRAVAGDEAELVGGATSFLSYNEMRKVDVDPKAGRVLIFQHRRLYHSGDDVKAGIKYTVRTDIMYELQRKE